MSGYNKKTGNYDLTWTQANWWLSRFGRRDIETQEMEWFADKLKRQGIRVVKVHPTWLTARAKTNDICHALQGIPDYEVTPFIPEMLKT